MRYHTWIRSIVLIGIALSSVGTANATIFERELGLPAEAESRRTTRKQGVQPGETVVLFDSNGPGCIRHWWLTLTHQLPKNPQQKQDVHHFRIRFFYDGETFYLDGETRPNALRGIGGEDVFNMSFGIWPEQTDWIGAPFTESRGEDDAAGSAYDGVMYRIFGPDPVWFQTSAKLNFNTKQNHTETLIYAYLDEKPAPEMLTPSSWHLAGPFRCEDMSDFEKREWAEEPLETWPAEHRAEFGAYNSNYLQGPKVEAVFKVPTTLGSRHGWVDFIHAYRGRSRSNPGAQPASVSPDF